MIVLIKLTKCQIKDKFKFIAYHFSFRGNLWYMTELNQNAIQIGTISGLFFVKILPTFLMQQTDHIGARLQNTC